MTNSANTFKKLKKPITLLAAIGFSAIVGYLDIVLLPVLAVFVLITGIALWQH